MTQQLEKKAFQTEVKRMLDIVIHSLYTDEEIFLRELISNGADAMEKVRYLQSAGQADPQGKALEIRITADEEANTLTLEDAGVGMTREELIENLGTIAHSGAREFIDRLKEQDSADVNLIGQFGVGFYSAFMVADRVTLHTRSIHGAPGVVWESAGDGYTLAEDDTMDQGTKIVLHLKEDSAEYAKPQRLKEVIRQYSSFVSFPVLVDGERVNTVEALWMKRKDDIEQEEYDEFYKFVADDYQEPRLTYHFSVDAPVSISAVLFVPQENLEMRGFVQGDAGVRLYSRRVMIQEVNDSLLPKWLRFLKGVVDSPDIPLNISRETMQDSVLMKKIGKILTGRFLKYLDELSKKDEEAYLAFYRRFGVFLKEGLASDTDHKERLIKLLRFESSKEEPGTLVSADDAIARAQREEDAPEEEGTPLYFMSGPDRETIEKSPYLEVFREKGLEVLYSFEGLDDYVLSMAGDYRGHSFVSAETADVALDDQGQGLDEAQQEEMAQWLKEVLGENISEAVPSKRLANSPVLVKNPMGMSSTLEKWLTMMDAKPASLPRILEFNPAHPLLVSLYGRRDDEALAKDMARQLYDNAMMAAGLPVDFPELVQRINRLMQERLQ